MHIAHDDEHDLAAQAAVVVQRGAPHGQGEQRPFTLENAIFNFWLWGGMMRRTQAVAIAAVAALVCVTVTRMPLDFVSNGYAAAADGAVALETKTTGGTATTAAPGARTSWYACLDPALNRTMVRLLLDDHLIEVDWKRAKTCLKDRSIAFGNPSPSQRMLTPRA